LNKLISTLEQFPSLIGCPALKWVISGNRPDPYKFSSYPSFISFDGDLGREYSTGELSRIAMMSGDFRHFSSWDGNQEIPEMDESKLKQVVHQAHLLHKPVRFWDAPDFKNAWYELMLLEVDFINTDHIELLAKFLEEKQQP
jgi:alkaline phosphatase